MSRRRSPLLRRWIATAFATAALVVASAATATANSLDMRPGGAISVQSFLRTEFLGVGVNIFCDVTLDFDIDAPVDKTEDVQFGEVSDGEIENCTEGADLSFLGFPWPLTYSTITGGLPSEINEVLFHIRGVEILTELEQCNETLGCLYRGDGIGYLMLFHILLEEPYVDNLTNIRVELTLDDDELTEIECSQGLGMLGLFDFDPTQTIRDL